MDLCFLLKFTPLILIFLHSMVQYESSLFQTSNDLITI